MAAEELLEAVKKNEFQALSARLSTEQYDDINTADGEGWTLLHYAVINGNIDMVKFLLKNGADSTRFNNEGDTPLHIASRKGCMENVTLLLKHASVCRITGYVNVKTTNREDTPLHIAARNGYTNIVIFLLNHGAIYNIKNKENKTPSDLSKAFSVTKTLNLIQECFDKAKNGDMTIIGLIEKTNLNEFSAIMNTRSVDNNKSLIETAMVNNHHKLTAHLLITRVDLDSLLNINVPQTPVNKRPESTANLSDSTTKDTLTHLKSLAEKYLQFSDMHIQLLRNMCQPFGSDINPSPWNTLKEGSYLLINAQDLIKCYKLYTPGDIENEHLKLVNDTLVYLQFDSSHITCGYTPEAYQGEVKCFVSKGQGTVYYNMLHSDMNNDVRVFIDIVEKNLDTPVKLFLEAVTQKLKNFL